MKNIFVLGLLLSIFLLSCSKEKNVETIDPAIQTEIQALVSDSIKVEEVKIEIEESTKKLDELLNDL